MGTQNYLKLTVQQRQPGERDPVSIRWKENTNSQKLHQSCMQEPLCAHAHMRGMLIDWLIILLIS